VKKRNGRWDGRVDKRGAGRDIPGHPRKTRIETVETPRWKTMEKETMDAPMEFDIESLPNIASELEPDADGMDLRSMMDRLSDLIECVEDNRVNALFNFPLYGLLLHDLSGLKCLEKDAAMFDRLLKEYSDTLDRLDERLDSGVFDGVESFSPITDLPSLIDASRMSESFISVNAAIIDELVEILPDVDANLEAVARRILGM
jgi:hypothetical protein